MVYELEITSGLFIENFSYRNSINSLPTAKVYLLSSFNNLRYSLSFKERRKEYIFINPKTSFNVVNRDWSKGLWSLDLVYANFMNYPPKNKTETICSRSLLGIMNYILVFYPQFTNYFNSHNIPNIGKVYRFDFNDMGIIGYLQYLEQFGYYWFIDMVSSNLVVNRYNNPIYKESNRLISNYSDLEITDELPEYKSIYLIKEPYDDNLVRKVVLDEKNPCVVLDTPVKSYTILSSTPNTYLLAFTVNGDKIGGQINGFSSALQLTNCISQAVNDCNNKYTYTFRGITSCSNPGCATAPICDRRENETNNVVDCNGDIYLSYGVDCIGQFKMVVPCNLVYTGKKIEIQLSNFCDMDNSCILDGIDLEFDRKQITEIITSNLDLEDTTPASISIANIDSTLWNLFKSYYTLKAKVKRKYKVSNPVCNGKLEVGYFYDLLINNTLRKDLLLEDLNLDTTDKGYKLNIILSEYI